MKRQLVRLLMASCCLVAVSYAALFVSPTATPWAPAALAVGANGIIMSLMAIGAVRHDTMPRSLAIIFVGLFVLCAGAFVFALLSPAQEGISGTLLLGLPVRTAVVLYGVGVVPIAILPLAYALTFDASTLNDDDLVRVRETYAGMRAKRDAA